MRAWRPIFDISPFTVHIPCVSRLECIRRPGVGRLSEQKVEHALMYPFPEEEGEKEKARTAVGRSRP